MSQQEILRSITNAQLKSDLPQITVGDTIDVHRRIIEGEKERIQVYRGVLIARRGGGINETITVRRIVADEGVELVLPLHSPRIAKIEVVRRGDARRAKLYYLRERVGKKRRLRDQRRGLQHLNTEREEAPAPPVEESPQQVAGEEAPQEVGAASET